MTWKYVAIAVGVAAAAAGGWFARDYIGSKPDARTVKLHERDYGVHDSREFTMRKDAESKDFYEVEGFGFEEGSNPRMRHCRDFANKDRSFVGTSCGAWTVAEEAPDMVADGTKAEDQD